MTNQQKSKLLDLIRDGEVQQAIDSLLSMEPKDSLRKEALIIASRFSNLEKDNSLGVITLEQFKITENRIIAHLIEVIEQSDDRVFPKEESIVVTNPDKPAIWKYVTALVVLIGISVVLAKFMNFNEAFSAKGKSGKLQLTVFVTDFNDNVVLEHEGVLNTSIGNRPMRETIGEHGRTNFGDILPEYLGDTLSIGILADDWKIADGNNTFVFTGEPIHLKVEKDERLGLIKGSVMSRDGQHYIEDAVVRVNADTTVLTDRNGFFKLLLPEYMRIHKKTDRYLLTVTKEGYQTTSEYYSPMSTDAEIRLPKNQ